MSLVPYWLRFMRNALHHDPVYRALQEPLAVFSRDPFFREADKLLENFQGAVHPHHGIEGVYSPNEVKADGEKVELMLDVKNFAPEQINVKTVGNEIMIEGKKEVKRDDGWTRSHFERRFLLPEGFPPERVECHLDKGKLKVIAFRDKPLKERAVPIQESSNPAIK